MRGWLYVISIAILVPGAFYMMYLAIFWGWAGATPSVDYDTAERYFQIFGFASVVLLGVSLAVLFRLWKHVKKIRNSQGKQ